jgi:hypothetical protein
MRRVSTAALEHPDIWNHPEFVRYFFTQAGLSWLYSDDYASRISFFRKYVRQYPDQPTAYEMLAGLFWYSGQ